MHIREGFAGSATGRESVVCADHHCDLLFAIKSQGPSWLFPLGSDLPCLVPEINQDGQSKGKAVHYTNMYYSVLEHQVPRFHHFVALLAQRV